MMKHKAWLLAATVLVVGGSLATEAQARWRGVNQFNCGVSRGNWNFDGLHGPYTTRAVRNFQKAKGLKVDGVVGPETMRALGLPYRRTLRCGMGGNDVYKAQNALARAGFWYGAGAVSAARPTPRPEVIITPVPTPAWVDTPEQVITPEPTLAPATPAPTPEATPMPAESPLVNRPSFELKGGNWNLPLNAGSTNYDLAFRRLTPEAEARLWLGDFGLGLGLTNFNQSYTTFRTLPYFAANTPMTDAVLLWRSPRGFWNGFVGYRGLGLANVNFGQGGLGFDVPMGVDWLWLNGRAGGGYSPSAMWFADGQANLALRFGFLELSGGFRHLSLGNPGTGEPVVNLNGPHFGAKLAF